MQVLLSSLADLLMPRVCVVCGRALLSCEKHLCMECGADMPLTCFEGLVHNPMADKFNALVEAPQYVRATALFYYRAGYQDITRELKYHRNFPLGRWAAAMLGRRMSLKGWGPFDAVVPVPLHPSRRLSRGYNQAELIASVLSRELGAPLETGLLRRVRRTVSQTSLSARERCDNVAGAFAAVPQRRLGAGFSPPGTVLLVDDVFTTGATLAACHDALRAVFGDSVRISVATLAYVGDD